MNPVVMKKIQYILLGISITLFGIAAIHYFFPTTNYDIAKQEFSDIKNNLIVSEERQDNFIEVYQLSNKKIIINTYSKDEADMAEQFSFNPHVTIDKSDIQVSWNSESDDSVGFYVQIKIEKDGAIFFNRKVTFIERTLQAINGLFNTGK